MLRALLSLLPRLLGQSRFDFSADRDPFFTDSGPSILD
jgi:hypothetical protein